MKPANPLWFKVLALGIAVGLGGGYVWKRQQAAVAPPQPSPQPSVEVKPQDQPGVLLLSGSKSGAVNLVDPPPAQAPPPVGIEPAKRLMPSSKSMILVEPDKETKPEPQEPKQP